MIQGKRWMLNCRLPHTNVSLYHQKCDIRDFFFPAGILLFVRRGMKNHPQSGECLLTFWLTALKSHIKCATNFPQDLFRLFWQNFHYSDISTTRRFQPTATARRLVIRKKHGLLGTLLVFEIGIHAITHVFQLCQSCESIRMRKPLTDHPFRIRKSLNGFAPTLDFAICKRLVAERASYIRLLKHYIRCYRFQEKIQNLN